MDGVKKRSCLIPLRILRQVADTVVRANLLTTLGFFGRLASPHMEAFALIGRENMRESPFYQDILDEGRAEGERTAILETLGLRFGRAAAAEFQEGLNAITDLGKLTELVRTAVKCRGIGGFRRALRARGSGQ